MPFYVPAEGARDKRGGEKKKIQILEKVETKEKQTAP